jgi:hypothetical protein
MTGRELKFHHKMLSSGPDFESCTRKVLSFFQAYQLVRYSQIKFLKEYSLPASHPEFWDKIEKAVLENHLVLNQLIKELGDEEVTNLKDLEEAFLVLIHISIILKRIHTGSRKIS